MAAHLPTGALLLALRRPGRPFEANPDPDIPLEEGSVLIALGTADELATLRRRVDAPLTAPVCLSRAAAA